MANKKYDLGEGVEVGIDIASGISIQVVRVTPNLHFLMITHLILLWVVQTNHFSYIYIYIYIYACCSKH